MSLRIEDLDVSKLKSIVKEEITLCGCIHFAASFAGIRTKNGHFKFKFRTIAEIF